MIVKTITYEDFDGNTHTEDFRFNLTKAELVELEYSEQGGITAVIRQLVQEEDNVRIVELFKKIIKVSYGKKSLDGKRFEKSDEIWNDFSQSNAYSELFMELATDADKGAAFINSIVPKGYNPADEKGNLVDSGKPASGQTVQGSVVKTDAEILAMNPKDMSRDELQRAFQLKSTTNS